MSLYVKAMGTESPDVAPSSPSPCRTDEESRVRISCQLKPLNNAIGCDNVVSSMRQVLLWSEQLVLVLLICFHADQGPARGISLYVVLQCRGVLAR